MAAYPADAREVEDLLKNADQALYVAKGAGRNRFSFFTPALQDAAQNRVRIEVEDLDEPALLDDEDERIDNLPDDDARRLHDQSDGGLAA